MAKMVVSQDTLNMLLAQAKAAGNSELAAQLEQAIANAKTLKTPNHIEDWDDASEALKQGLLTIRKDSVRKAAELLYKFGTTVADHRVREEILQVFSRAIRNGDSNGDSES